jgi:hypothetical protein
VSLLHEPHGSLEVGWTHQAASDAKLLDVNRIILSPVE